MKRNKKKCPHCEQLISLSNYKKHYNVCLKNDKKFKATDFRKKENELYECPVCQKEFTIHAIVNHYYRKHTEEGRKWMKEHCNNSFNTKGRKAWNSGLSKYDDIRLENRGKKLSRKIKEGKIVPSFLGKKHSNKTKQILAEKALASDHRRLRRNIINYKGVLLDSVYELQVAQELDKYEISWIRPKPLKYKDQQNVVHNYFPDFYLPKYDVYLDPKNQFLIEHDSEKVYLAESFNNVQIIILDKNHLVWDKIKKLIIKV